jgi:hypothetical protein
MERRAAETDGMAMIKGLFWIVLLMSIGAILGTKGSVIGYEHAMIGALIGAALGFAIHKLTCKS